MKRPSLAALAAGVLFLASAAFGGPNPGVRDNFDRDISQNGITLIDWEGYMGNPAIEFGIVPPSGASFPIQVAVSAPEPRMYFDMPSTGSAQGPRKQLTISGDAPVTMAAAI